MCSANDDLRSTKQQLHCKHQLILYQTNTCMIHASSGDNVGQGVGMSRAGPPAAVAEAC